MFPTITEARQKLYESICLNSTEFKNSIPDICGYYGRECRRMNDKADRMLCSGCTLSVFASTLDTVLETCDEKGRLGIRSLYDSDILDIQTKLKEKGISVDISYIEDVLEELTKSK